MNKLLTVHSAEPADIWPDGSDLSPAAEREIMALAKTIPHADVVRSGHVFAPWYTPFYLAEGMWRQRQVQKAETKARAAVTEGENAKKIASLERRLARTSKDLAVIYDTLLSKDDPDGELRLFKLIKSLAWKQITEHKILRDCGVWDVDRLYGPGAACTDRGALWIAQQENKAQRPGEGACWRLSHKSDLTELRTMIRDIVRDEQHKHWTKGTKT